jgi:hypothetical protein
MKSSHQFKYTKMDLAQIIRSLNRKVEIFSGEL